MVRFGFSMTPWVKRLIIANVAVFLVMLVFRGVAPYLAFVPMAVLQRPWTVVTYMFVHGGFSHIFFNMLGLFFFGPPLEARWGSGAFLKYYFACGLGGAAFSFIFAPHAAVIGASAAIFGVMLAFAMNWPDAPIYIFGIFPVAAKWLVAILVAMQVLSVFLGGGGNIAYFAHLGGFAVGFVYMKWWPPAGSATGWGGVQQTWRGRPVSRPGGSPGLGAWIEKLRRAGQKSRLRVVRDEPSASRPEPGPRRRVDDHLLDEIDRVLDKIHEKGMASLTDEERRILDDASRRYRTN